MFGWSKKPAATPAPANTAQGKGGDPLIAALLLSDESLALESIQKKVAAAAIGRTHAGNDRNQ